MATQIKLTYNKKEYILEYTRRSVETIERRGFVGDEVETKPVTMIPLLYSGAFQCHHPSIKQTLIDEIYESLGNKAGFISALAEMYSETLDALVSDGEKNVQWEKISP